MSSLLRGLLPRMRAGAAPRSRAAGRTAWRGFASAVKPKPYTSSSRVYFGVLGFGIFSFGVSYAYKQWFDPIVSHPAILEAVDKLNQSRLFFGSDSDDGLIRVGGVAISVESYEPFKVRFGVSSTRGYATSTVEAHQVDETTWVLDSLTVDYPSSMDRYLYDGETGQFFKGGMPAEDLTITDVVTVGVENTYGNWYEILWQQWSGFSVYKKGIGIVAVCIPIAAFTYMQKIKPPVVCRRVLELIPENSFLNKAMGGGVEVSSPHRGKIGKSAGYFSVDVKGTSQNGVAKFQVFNDSAKKKWRVTDARFTPAGSNRQKKFSMDLD